VSLITLAVSAVALVFALVTFPAYRATAPG
jgi:hypothetical protein